MFFSTGLFAANITIIESQSFNGGHDMDMEWQAVAVGMGHTVTIMPQTTLDNNAFFATTDILIISSGVGTLPAPRPATIEQFLMTGKPVYIQGEYLSTYDTDIAFANIIGNMGGTFTWQAATVPGTLAPMNVLGTFATTPNAVASINYFWYGATGTGDCNMSYFLEYGGQYFGFQYCPSNPAYGSIIMTTDQDWVRTTTSVALCENIIHHLENQATLCSVTSNINITFTILDENCGAVDGQATANPTGGSAPYTYQWDAAAANQTTQAATGLAAGTYDVTVTDAAGCTAIATATVGSQGSLSVIMSSTNALCNAACDGTGTASPTGSPPYTYQWDAVASSQTTATATGLCAGSYTLTVTDNTGCTSIQSVTITEPPALTATTTPTNVLCNGDLTGQLICVVGGGTGPYTYIWSNGATTQNITGIPAGCYTVTATDANGCTITMTDCITEPTAINLTTGSIDESCGGNNGEASVIASGGTPGYTYSWDDPAIQITAAATGLATGTYNVTVTDLNGCTNTASVMVNFSGSIVASISAFNDVLCNGVCDGDATATCTGAAPFTYLWDDPSAQTTAIATGLCAGIYNVTATDAGGCTAITSVTITEPPLLDTTFSAFDEVCSGLCNGQAVVIPTGGAPPYSYTWSNGAPNNPAVTGLCPGNYALTVTDLNGCTIDIPFTVNGPPPISITDSTLDINCNGNANGSINISVSGGNPNYTYLWSNASTNEDQTNLTAGIYTVTVTDNNSCDQTAMFNIIEPPALVIGTAPAPDTTICLGGTGVMTAIATGGVGPYTYIWDQGLPNGSPQPVSPPTSTCYNVYAQDVNGCTSASSTVCVNLFPALVVSVSPDDTVCDGNSTNINATGSAGTGGPYAYVWDNGAGTGQNVTVTPGNYPNPTTYTVTVTDGCPTPVTATVTINHYPTPVVDFTVDQLDGCSPTAFNFSNNTLNTAGCTWELTQGAFVVDTFCAGVSHTFTQPGSYDISLYVQSPEGCNGSLTQQDMVTIHPNPVAIFSADPWETTVMNTTVNFTDLSMGSIATWNYTFYNPQGSIIGTSPAYDPVFEFPEDTGMYPVQLQVTTPYGCMDDTTLYVLIDGLYHFWAPNAFTPDGDGLNDIFFPKGISINEDDFTMYIFDRWGELIYETNDINEGWDGTARNKGGRGMVQEGVYVWKVHTSEATRDKLRHKYLGHVTLIK